MNCYFKSFSIAKFSIFSSLGLVYWWLFVCWWDVGPVVDSASASTYSGRYRFLFLCVRHRLFSTPQLV